MKWPSLLLCVAILLAIVFGGQISTDASPLLGGLDGLLGAMMGSGEVATLPHALIGLLIITAAIACLLSRKIIQCPPAPMSIVMGAFFGLVMLSTLASSYKSTSMPIALEWVTYGITFFTTTALIGRRQGPQALLGACFVGSVIVAINGVMEYGRNKAIDPSWRIFAGWVNPNATAAALLIGLFIGLMFVAQSERLVALLSGMGVVLIALALALTGSKGGILALGVGLAAFAILGLIWSSPKALLKPAGALLAALVVVFAMQASSTSAAAPGATAPSALGRVANAGGTTEQSAGFRKLLWQGQVDLIRENPVGFGVGTYRFWSARPGLTTQTHLGHQVFLQLGTEAGLAAPLLLILIGGMWVARISRGVRRVPPANGLSLAAIVATVAAIGAHSFVDSDLYYFGIGVPFFALLGCGALLASDAVSPEFLPRPLQFSATGFVALVAAMSLYFGFTEVVRARLRADLALGDRAGAQAGSELLASIAPFDGEAVYLRGRAASSIDDRLRLTELASVLAPSPRNLRSLAREQGARGDNEAAISTLNRALLADPRSLPTLSALLNQYRAAENVEGARQVAERLIAVEPTPYFQVRSLPEIVPTETYAARLYLASITTSAKEKIALLSGCVKGYAAYANTTASAVRRSLKDEPTGNFAGETLQSVNENLSRGQLAAEELAKAYYSVDDAAGGADAAAAARDFAARLAM